MERFFFEVPGPKRKAEAISYLDEFAEYASQINGSGGLNRFHDDYEGWLEKLNTDYHREPDEEKVPARTYFLIRESDDRIVGMINIRLALNERLKKYGGHIGYSIRPTERGKGYNKINLYLALKVCDQYGIGSVFMDADLDNPASWKTMEALGGKRVREYRDDQNAHCTVVDYTINVKKALTEHPEYERMVKVEFRKVFDTIPEQFDRYRPRYCGELFSFLIGYAGIGPGRSVLELGPGTGQATDPILKTGCDYHAIELGEHLFAVMKRKYGQYPNFHIVNDDFITHDFREQQFDLIYSAATIQWIPEETAFSKTFDLLRPGGVLAMMLTRSDYRSPDEALYQKIQKVYDELFRPETPYPHGGFRYENAPAYGYTDFQKLEFYGERKMDADTYATFCGTHCDHIVIPEPIRSRFFEALRKAVLESGNEIVFRDTYVLYLAKKPGHRTPA